MSARRPALFALAAVLAALPAGRAQAQDTPEGVRPYRFTVEGLLAQSYLNDDLVGGDKNTFGGYGVRVLFNRSTPATTLRSVTDRASVGAFRTSFGLRSGTGDLKNTDLAVTPAIGTRLSLFSGLGVRGDLRAPIVFGNTTPGNGVAEGGISLGV